MTNTRNTIDLSGAWEFKLEHGESIPETAAGARDWLPAYVPGTVHTDLLANGIIADPFYRMNEKDVQWIEQQQWVYRRTFDVAAADLKNGVVELIAEGLDTYAEIRINGKKIASTTNMFVEYRFGVKKFLRAGANIIEVAFDSPEIRSRALEKKHGVLRVAHEPQRVYARKAQYSFGWDWGPKLTTSGIWKNIRIEFSDGVRLKDPFGRVVSMTKQKAVIEVSVEVEGRPAKGVALKVAVSGLDCQLNRVAKNALKGVMKFRFTIVSPKLWWPNGYGEQPMYAVAFSLVPALTMTAEEPVESVSTSFAIRTVALVQKKDAEGASFVIHVNGVPVYCKGADWIPCDTFIPRIADTTYERLLTLAKDAHMNMVRVWGGGYYEKDILYNLCDRLGLMVWQDFMFACGEYPEQKWFVDEVKVEAEQAVKRLRNHPSIVVWCGNNECEWLFCTENPDKTADDMNGAPIFKTLLPAVCKTLDGTRPYWRSSPFGTGFPNSESNGNHHQWHVWSYWKDYKEYEKDNARFVTEFGFQAPANVATWNGCTLPEDRHPQHPVIEHHNKQIEGTERLYRFQSAHYKVTDDFEDFVYQGQLVQAEALKLAIEHWRRRKFRTAGSLYWQINDCWPVSSWATVDSALRPKAGYYFTKKFFAPLLVSIRATKDFYEIWLTNDTLKRIAGVLHISLHSFLEKERLSKRAEVSAGANISTLVHKIPLKIFSSHDPLTHYAHIAFTTGEGETVENRFYFAEPKHLILPSPELAIHLSAAGEGSYSLVLSSPTIVKNLCIEFEGEDIVFSDNYFDMDPSSTRTIVFGSERSLEELRERFTWRSLL